MHNKTDLKFLFQYNMMKMKYEQLLCRKLDEFSKFLVPDSYDFLFKIL